MHELCPVLCDSHDGRGVRGRMDRCICMAVCLHCSPETITISLVNQLYPNTKLKVFKKKTALRSSVPQKPEWEERAGGKQERREGKWDGMQLTLAQCQITCQLNAPWPSASWPCELWCLRTVCERQGWLERWRDFFFCLPYRSKICSSVLYLPHISSLGKYVILKGLYLSSHRKENPSAGKGDVTGVPKMQWTQGVPEKLISQVPGMEQKLWPTALDTVRLKGSEMVLKSCLIEWVNLECLLVLLGASSKCYWSITYN